MARPRKASEEKRDDWLNLRLTARERAQIEFNARAFGLSPSEYMRRRALDYRLPVAVAEQQALASYATALMRLGVNLNQIAHHMNAGRGPPAYLAALIARIDAELDKIYEDDLADGPG